jgi:mycothiol synthase
MTDVVVDGFMIASARASDLDDIVELIEAADRSLGVPPDPIREELAWVWQLPTTRLDRDTRIIRDGETPVAYGEATWKDPDAGGPLELVVRIHPDYTQTGIGASLMNWAQAVAEERGCEGIRAWIVDRDGYMRDLLRLRAFVRVRSVYTMWKTLATEPDAFPEPGGVSISPYTDADERTLYELHEAAFADHWDFRPMSFERWNVFLHGEGWDPSLVFLAKTDEVAVGYIVGFLEEMSGLIGILGVLKGYRGRGIARALLHRSFTEFWRHGKKDVRLGVDTQNVSGAVGLYEAVGMSIHRRYDAFDLGTSEAQATPHEGTIRAMPSRSSQGHTA